MIILQLLPAALSLVILAAHFSRHGQPTMVALSLALLGLLAVPRPWAARVLQAALLLGAAEWVRTTFVLAAARSAQGRPSSRMVAILVAVAAVTAASAFVFGTRRVRRRFRIPGRDSRKI